MIGWRSSGEAAGVIDQLPGLVWTASPDGQADFLNTRWCDYTGMSREDALGAGWLNAIHPDDQAHALGGWQAMVASGVGSELEARLRRFDGVYRWFLFRTAPITDEDGEVERWSGINTDIEDRKQAESALRLRDQQAQAALLDAGRYADWILNTVPGMTALMTPAGEVEAANQQLLDYFGKTIEDLRRWGTGDAIHPDDLPTAFQALKTAIPAGLGWDFEHRIRGADGVYRWFQTIGLPLRDGDGGVVRYCSLITNIEERKRAEEALLSSESDLKTIINTLPTTAWATDAKGYVEFLSDRWLDYAGFTAEQGAGLGWGQVIHPDDAPGLFGYWQSCLETGEPVDTEARMRRFDGQYRWFLFRANPLRDQNGTILKWFGTNIDIEDRKRAEQDLRQSEAMLAEGQRLSETGSFSWRLDTDEVLFSEELNRIFEFGSGSAVTLEQIIARVYPEDLTLLAGQMSTARAGIEDHRYEIRLQMPSGVVKHVYVVGHRIAEHTDRPVFIGAIRDITESKQAEEEMRRTTEHLIEAEAISKTGSATFRWATDEHYWSDELCRIWGYEPGIRISLEMVSARIHPDDMHVFREFGERTIGRRSVEFRLLMPDGQIKYIRAVVNVSRATPEAPPEGVAALQDVTEHWLNEQALNEVRAQLGHMSRVTALGALTASIAHEVNQPLSGIITNASTCLKMLGADPPNIVGAAETVRRTMRDGNRAADVIKRLRALFAQRGVTREPVDLNEAVRELIALSAGDLQRRGVSVRAELADDLPTACGDRVQLQQVILNLLLNAADAMSEVEGRARQVSIVTRRDAADNVSLAVSDAGVGLDADSAERLFDAFFTTKSEGMGIGLSVSRSIIDSHGGKLTAAPNDGPGATFTFTLPLTSDDSAGGSDPKSPGRTAPQALMVQR